MVCVDGIKAIPTLDMEDSKVDVSKRQACEEVFLGNIDFWINYKWVESENRFSKITVGCCNHKKVVAVYFKQTVLI